MKIRNMNMLQLFLGLSEHYESINGRLNGFALAIKVQAYTVQYSTAFLANRLSIRKSM